MSVWLTNGATVLQFRNGDFQIPLKTPKRKVQRLINNTARLPVAQTISEATDQILTAEIALFRANQGVYAGADSLYSFWESADPTGVDGILQTFMLTDSDGDTHQCRFIDDLGGGLQESKKDSLFVGTVRLLVEHTLPTDLLTGLYGWWTAYDMEGNGGDLALWATTDPVGGTGKEWDDINGNYDGSQGTSGERPLWKTSQINSRPAVDFDGTNDNLDVGFTSLFNGKSDQAWSLCAVIDDQAPADGTRAVISVGTTSAQTDEIQFLLRNNSPADHQSYIDDGAVTTTAGGGTPDTNPHIVSVINYGTTLSMWVDGTNIVSAVAHNVGQINVEVARIGAAMRANVEGRYWNGRIGEAVLAGVAFSTLQRRQQEYRLSDMWGIDLTG